MISFTDLEDALRAWVVTATGLTTEGQVIWSGGNSPRTANPRIELRLRAIRRLGHDWVDREDNFLTGTPLTFTAAASDVCTAAGHGLQTGDGPVHWTTTGMLPGGAELATDYWIIRLSADTFSIATSLYRANAGNAVDLTDAGSGIHTQTLQTGARRVGEEVLRRARGPRRAAFALQAFSAIATGDASAVALLERVAAYARLPSVRDALVAAGVGIGSLGDVQSVDGVIGSAHFEARALLEAQLNLAQEVTELGGVIEFVEVTRESPDPDETFWSPEDPSL